MSGRFEIVKKNTNIRHKIFQLSAEDLPASGFCILHFLFLTHNPWTLE